MLETLCSIWERAAPVGRVLPDFRHDWNNPYFPGYEADRIRAALRDMPPDKTHVQMQCFSKKEADAIKTHLQSTELEHVMLTWIFN